MSDTKISALSSATTPLAGTEVLPIVQSSTTKKVAVSDLTAGRSVSAADFTASTGNFIQGTAAKGINFTANTPASGMTSQLLNWYEEGTWTPGYSAWTTAPTTIFATYTRIGRQVTATLYASDGVNAGGEAITGLPFTSNSSSASAAFGSCSDTSIRVAGSIIQSSSSIINIPTANFTTKYWQITAVYFV